MSKICVCQLRIIVDSLYNRHHWDQDLVSVIERVRNSGNYFQQLFSARRGWPDVRVRVTVTFSKRVKWEWELAVAHPQGGS